LRFPTTFWRSSTALTDYERESIAEIRRLLAASVVADSNQEEGNG
jgi:hypothetical protein